MTPHCRSSGLLKEQAAVVALPRKVKTSQLTAMMKDWSIIAKKIAVVQKKDSIALIVHDIIRVSHVNEISNATSNKFIQTIVAPFAISVKKAIAESTRSIAI